MNTHAALSILGLTVLPKTKDELDLVYKRLRSAAHPDKGGAADKFIELKEAYEICINSLNSPSSPNRICQVLVKYPLDELIHLPKIVGLKTDNGLRITTRLINVLCNDTVDIHQGGKKICVKFISTVTDMGEYNWYGTKADLSKIVHVPIVNAITGTKLKVETPHGTVELVIPECTESGTKLRIAGHGPIKGETDLYIEVVHQMPKSLTSIGKAVMITASKFIN